MKCKFVADISLRPHQCCKNFPTGQKSVDYVDVCVKAMINDEQHHRELDALRPYMSKWPESEELGEPLALGGVSFSTLYKERLSALKVG